MNFFSNVDPTSKCCLVYPQLHSRAIVCAGPLQLVLSMAIVVAVMAIVVVPVAVWLSTEIPFDVILRVDGLR